MKQTGPRPYLPSVYVAVWPHGIDRRGRQYAFVRARCSLCGWRGRVMRTYEWEHIEHTRQGHAAARQGRRHEASAHPDGR